MSGVCRSHRAAFRRLRPRRNGRRHVLVLRVQSQRTVGLDRARHRRTDDRRARRSSCQRGETMKIWNFAMAHIFFWRKIPQPYFVDGTTQATALAAEFDALETTIGTLDNDALTQITTEFKDELDANGASVTEMRSRAAQLLTASGFVAVLATIGTAVPPKLAGQVLTYVLVAIALYALFGTMWLTTQALAVREWNVLQLK